MPFVRVCLYVLCSNSQTYLLMRWQGPDALAVCQAHRGLPRAGNYNSG